MNKQLNEKDYNKGLFRQPAYNHLGEVTGVVMLSCYLTVHHRARVTVVNLAKMVDTGAPLRHAFPVFMR